MGVVPLRRRHRGTPAKTGRSLLAAVALAALLTGSTIAASVAGPWPSETAKASVDPAVAAILAVAAPTDQIPVIAILRAQADARHVSPRAAERRDAAVVRTLKGTALGAQGPLVAALHAAQRRGLVDSVTPLWILDAVSFSGRPEVVRAVATRPDVASIVAEQTLVAPPPVTSADGSAVEPNVAGVGAPDLWALGHRGGGVTVAILDTGVEASHPDLAAQWRGGPGAWYDPYGQHASPIDLNGHGTQTAGIAVGRSSGGTAIGVAPDAQWIAARVFNDAGTGTSTAIHLALQWVLDPDGNPLTSDAPRIVNNSWTLSTPGCDLGFEPDLAALVAADITPVFAAGNFGPASGSAPSPANNPDAFAVGSVDGAGLIAASSSRGPTTCGGSTGTYPEIVAPGVNIRSSDRYGMYATGSGTSLAAPHVTGALALLHEAVPTASAEAVRLALRSAAVDLGPTGPDETYGAGRLDILAAFRTLTGSGPGSTPTPPPTATPTATPSATPSAGPGDSLGPTTTVPALAPNPANGSGPVTIAATITDASTGGSPIVAAEWFIGAVGSPGTGRPMTGAFGSVTVTASASLSASELATLPDGSHATAVRGRDAAGVWGQVATASLTVDRTPPAVSAVALTPPISQGAASMLLTSSLSDATSSVSGGEWFIGTDPGLGNGTPLQAADGSFGGATESAVATIGLAGRAAGELPVSVRARDGTGSWSAVTTTSALITPSDGLFADGFENGTLSRWSGQTGGSKLAVTTGAAFAGAFGLNAGVTAGASGYVTDTTPAAAAAYHARFGFDGRGMSTGGKAIDVFTALTSRNALVLEVHYRRDSTGSAQLRIGAARSGSTLWSNWSTLPSGRHAVEVGWQSARSATVALWLDGVVAAQLTGLDTHSLTIETVRLGLSAGLAKTMSGELQFDRFVSSTGSLIGP